VNLRDFESIRLYFSEEDIEELQAAIDERRSTRQTRDVQEDCPGALELPTYLSNVVAKAFLEVSTPPRIAPVQHP
jgi:hypothetical protein